MCTGVILEFVEKRRGAENRYAWTPLEESAEFTPDWWDDPPYLLNDPWYVQVLSDVVEVARVELDNTVHVNHYDGAPHLGSTALEIQFIEVARQFRRRAVGTAVVRELAATNPGRRLVAFS